MKLFKRLNQCGFSHHLLVPVVVILTIAGVGTYILTQSHAETTTGLTGFTKIAPFNTHSGVCYNGTNTVQVQSPAVQPGSIARNLFNLIDDSTIGTSPSSTSPNKNTFIYANPGDSISVSIYHATSGETSTQQLDPSNALSTQILSTSTMSKCPNNFVVPEYVGNGYSVSPISLKATISRAKATICNGGDICSPNVGVKIVDTATDVGGFSFSNPNPSQGGFLWYASGGLQPNGGSILSPLLINPSLTNGTYTGTSTLTLNGLTGKTDYTTSLTISYTVILTD